MYKALENIVELVVDGEYDELQRPSSGLLAVEDLRRRVEDECPRRSSLPPREHYGIEAITRSEELEAATGWAFFLDLWARTAGAAAHRGRARADRRRAVPGRAHRHPALAAPGSTITPEDCAMVLHQHPFASFCQKVLIALYESSTLFDTVLVEGRDEHLKLWPLGTIPVLVDGDLVLPESTSIIEHVDDGRLTSDPDARLWDRIADNHLDRPMQKIVTDNLRPAGRNDPQGVQDARAPARHRLSPEPGDPPWPEDFDA